MTGPPLAALEKELAGYLSWWSEAGVSHALSDTPRALLRMDEPAPSDKDARPDTSSGPSAAIGEVAGRQPTIGGNPQSWPRDLAAFREWWLTEPLLELGGTGPRLASRGEPGAALMVLVPMPEPGDRDRLLEGREGTFVAAMLSAMRIAPADTVIAAALPRYMAAPDWTGLAKAGLGALARHHLSLARPARLLVLGHAILPLLGHGSTQAPGDVRETAMDTGAGTIQLPTLAGLAPARLLENARQRASLWRRWLAWTQDDFATQD